MQDINATWRQLWNILTADATDTDLEYAGKLIRILEKSVGASNPDLIRAKKLVWFLDTPLIDNEEMA